MQPDAPSRARGLENDSPDGKRRFLHVPRATQFGPKNVSSGRPIYRRGKPGTKAMKYLLGIMISLFGLQIAHGADPVDHPYLIGIWQSVHVQHTSLPTIRLEFVDEDKFVATFERKDSRGRPSLTTMSGKYALADPTPESRGRIWFGPQGHDNRYCVITPLRSHDGVPMIIITWCDKGGTPGKPVFDAPYKLLCRRGTDGSHPTTPTGAPAPSECWD